MNGLTRPAVHGRAEISGAAAKPGVAGRYHARTEFSGAAGKPGVAGRYHARTEFSGAAGKPSVAGRYHARTEISGAAGKPSVADVCVKGCTAACLLLHGGLQGCAIARLHPNRICRETRRQQRRLRAVVDNDACQQRGLLRSQHRSALVIASSRVPR